jgi:ribose/xylose/arabinose/galactoside ABC-type transport system permease subunit
MTGTMPVTTGPARPSSWVALRRFSARNAVVYALVLIVAAAQISYPQFLTWVNVQNLLVQNAGVAVVAIGMTFVLVGGGFDLSVVGTLSLGSVLVAGLCMESGLAFGPALLLTLAVTAVLGALNGVIVTKLGVNAFIATLGTAAAFAGIAAMYSDSQPISVSGVPGFETLGAGQVLGLQLPVVMLAVLLVLGGLVLHRSTYGRNLFAVGGNPEAARLAGLPVDRVLGVAFVISAASAGLAGSMMASTLATGQIEQLPNVALDAIAAVVIGGTSLFGGEGAMWRTAVGVLILATLNNLFSSLALDAPMQNVIKGAVLIVAVAFEGLSRRRNW